MLLSRKMMVITTVVAALGMVSRVLEKGLGEMEI